ncbi:hypothetical protein P8452_47918 [Trifolium repens]|nr:hypothetical protein P8452_47918 [Trifolium repens]
MGDEQELFDNLPPSLVLLESVVLKIFDVFWVTGFSYSMVLITKHVDYEYMRIMGMLAKGLLTGEYSKNPNPDDVFNYVGDKHKENIHSVSRTHDESEHLNGYLQGLKDIVETLPSGLDTSATNSIMPTNKSEQKKTLLLSGALISRRVIEV